MVRTIWMAMQYLPNVLMFLNQTKLISKFEYFNNS